MTPEERQDRIDASLRRGLATLPVGEPSRGFDEAVLSALRRPSAPRRLWRTARPALASAVVSLAATVVLIHWALQSPVALEPGRATAASVASAPSGVYPMEAGPAAYQGRMGILAALTGRDPAPRPRPAGASPRPADRGDGTAGPRSQRGVLGGDRT